MCQWDADDLCGKTGACEILRLNRSIHRFTTINSHSAGRKHNPLCIPGTFQFMQNIITLMISLERTISVESIHLFWYYNVQYCTNMYSNTHYTVWLNLKPVLHISLCTNECMTNLILFPILKWLISDITACMDWVGLDYSYVGNKPLNNWKQIGLVQLLCVHVYKWTNGVLQWPVWTALWDMQDPYSYKVCLWEYFCINFHGVCSPCLLPI